MLGDGNKTILRGHLFAFLAVVLWGNCFFATKILYRSFSAMQITYFRFLVSYFVLFLLSPKIHFEWKTEKWILVLSFFSQTLYYLAQNAALEHTSSANVSIFITFASILSVIGSYMVNKGSGIHRQTIIGFVIALSGVCLTVLNGMFVMRLSPVGDFLALVAAFSWAAYSVILEKHPLNLSPIVITRKCTGYALLATLPFFLHDFPKLSYALLRVDYILCVLLLGVFGSALCNVLWLQAYSDIGVKKTMNYIYLVPVVSAISSWLILGESLNALGFLGILMILMGVILGMAISERK